MGNPPAHPWEAGVPTRDSTDANALAAGGGCGKGAADDPTLTR
jgi:hypothetical protein